MRIIAGEFRSRKLLSPPDAETTRPIPDRVKESVFALLRGHIEGSMVFDGFAGSGAFGLEAISRGADRCVFVEKDRDAAALLRRNVEMLGAEERCEIVVGDVLGAGALARCPRPATIVFLDPPYPLVRAPLGWKRVKAQFERLIGCLGEDAFAIIRTPWPFIHLVTPETAAAVAAAPEEDLDKPGRGKRAGSPDARRYRDKKKRIRTGKLDDREVEIWSIEREGAPPLAELTEEEIAKLDDQEAQEQIAKEEAAVPERVIPDMAMAGAVGPETHEYGTMAVHFYAKAKSS